jgi:hypothetical protein
MMNTKRELLTEVNEKATTIIIKEISQAGAKLQYNAQGTAKGKYSAGHLETVDILQKPDGTFEYEARAIESTPEGDVIMLMGKETGKQVGPTSGSFQGELSFMTQSKELGWLNSAKGWVEGTTNQQTNEANIKVYITS